MIKELHKYWVTNEQQNSCSLKIVTVLFLISYNVTQKFLQSIDTRTKMGYMEKEKNMGHEQQSLNDDGVVVVKRLVEIPLLQTEKTIFDCKDYLTSNEKLVLMAINRITSDNYYEKVDDKIGLIKSITSLNKNDVTLTLSLLQQKFLVKKVNNDLIIGDIDKQLGLATYYE